MAKNLPLLTLLLALPSFSHASHDTSGSNLLTLPVSARPAALGEAFSAARNDISAFNYNPASLNSLKMGQASFLYQPGLADDAIGQLQLGGARNQWGLGGALAYYNGGDLELNDGQTTRTVKAKQDVMVSLGLSRALGQVSLGLTGKYLSSELAETAQASTVAVDLGLQHAVTSRLNFGLALQNLGGSLTYESEQNDLPRIARAGFEIGLSKKMGTTIFLDAPYHLVEHELNPGVGLEANLGVLALRAGYRSGRDLQGFSMGTGLELGAASLDYSFGLVQDNELRHRISLALKFAGDTAPTLVKKPETPPAPATTVLVPLVSSDTLASEATGASLMTVPPQKKPVMKRNVVTTRQVIKIPGVYLVKRGDTLEKIAKRAYGDSGKWTLIFDANEELITDPNVKDLTGRKLKLPKAN